MFGAMSVELSCQLTLLTPAKGGRATPLRSGWRGVVTFGERWTEEDAPLWPRGAEQPISLDEELLYGCELRLLTSTTVAPGETADVEVVLFALDESRPTFRRGAAFELREGANPIGRGLVVD
jgi:hypothetical protein